MNGGLVRARAASEAGPELRQLRRRPGEPRGRPDHATERPVTSPALKALAGAGAVRYYRPATASARRTADEVIARYLSTYCEGKTYYGNLEPALFKTLLDFAADTGTDFVWHLNMAFGRGKKSPAYEPWDAGDATGLLAAAGSALKGAMLFEEITKEGKKLGFDITPEQMANDLALMKAAPSKKTVVYGVLNQDSDQPSMLPTRSPRLYGCRRLLVLHEQRLETRA